MEMNSDLKEDVIGLTGYIFEHELEDMIEQFYEEPSYVEEGIISEEEADFLSECTMRNAEESNKVMKIVDKACDNPLNLHVYALAHRIFKRIAS
jgi:hypothetical protein